MTEARTITVPAQEFTQNLEKVDQHNLQQIIAVIKEQAMQENIEMHIVTDEWATQDPSSRRRSGGDIRLSVFSPQLAPRYLSSSQRWILFDRFKEFFRKALSGVDGNTQVREPDPSPEIQTRAAGAVQFRPISGNRIVFIPIDQESTQHFGKFENFIANRAVSVLLSQVPRQLK